MALLADQFKTLVTTEGLRAAIRWLNERVPYRYTAIFAFRGDTLRSVCLIDKEDANVTRCDDQPILDSYCIYIQRTGKRFAVEHAAADHRVDGHPKQHTFQCYYGIPLTSADGKLLGTVCHFDSDPVPVTEDVATVLDDLSPIITEAAFGEK